jgi:peptidyl-prolyl cis-trans isomerase C
MKHKAFFFSWLLIFALPACTVSKKSEGFTPFPTIAADAVPSPIVLQTETAAPTQEPLAALVNGEGIALSEYEAELLRYQAAQKTAEKPLEEQEKQKVLNDLIQQCLLSQWAKENGYTSTEEQFQQHLQSLIQESGGEQAFREWLQQNHYDEQSFKVALSRQLAAAWARDNIAAQVPTAAEQVHARQIYFYDEATAKQTMIRLNNGEAFEAIAAEFDPLTAGEWVGFHKVMCLSQRLMKLFLERTVKGDWK